MAILFPLPPLPPLSISLFPSPSPSPSSHPQLKTATAQRDESAKRETHLTDVARALGERNDALAANAQRAKDELGTL
jgi:hypothetical protein